ncbi:MAG: leucine-rich repeat protein [Clostridia bacterium]|nr:leucine-rich repeat protein [Clostridia bacterium]
MKKTTKTLLALLLSVLMLLGTLPLTVFAANDTIQYTYDADTKTLTFTGTGAMDDADVDFDSLFNSEDPFDTTTLPAWYQAYGREAEAIVVGENITRIGAGAFLDFCNVTSVTLPSTLTAIGAGAFMFCGALQTISFPAGLTEIGPFAFCATGLTAVDVPAGVTALREGAFGYCGKLQQVTLHEGMQTLEVAFPITNLQTLTIPSTVTSFSDEMIYGLQTIVNYSKTAVAGNCAYGFPQGDSVGAWFIRWEIENYGEILRVMFIEGQEDEEAFESLMPSINAWMQAHCGVTFASFNEMIAAVEHSGEEVNPQLAEVTIYCYDDSAEHTYAKNNGLDHYLIAADGTLGDTLCPDNGRGKAGENIDWWIDADTRTLHFSGSGDMDDNYYRPWRRKANLIEHVAFESPEGQAITSIGSYAFNGLTKLTELTVPEGVTSLGGYFLAGSGVKTLRLPASFAPTDYSDRILSGFTPDVITVAEGNDKLEIYHGSLYLKKTEYVWNQSGGTEMLTYTLLKMPTTGVGQALHPKTVYVEGYALEKLDGVTNFTIPASVRNLDSSALSGLANLATVTLEKRETPIGGWLNCFISESPAFTAFVVAEDDPCYFVKDGMLLNKENNKLVAVPCGLKNVVLDETVTGMEYHGDSLPGLESVTVLNPDFSIESGFVQPETKIIGHTGSTAEDYAMQNGNEFESLEGLTLVSVVIDTSEAQTVFEQFDWPRFNEIGLKAVATYSDGSTRIFTEGFSYEGDINPYRTGTYSFKVTYRDLKADFTATFVRKVIPVDYVPGEGYAQYYPTYTYSEETSIVEVVSDKNAPGRIDFSFNESDRSRLNIVVAEDEALQNVLYTFSPDDTMCEMDFEAGKTYYVGITAPQLHSAQDTFWVSVCPFLICSHPSATFEPAETGTCQQYLKKDHYVCDVCGRDLLLRDGAYYEPNSGEYKEWGPHTPGEHHEALAPTCTTGGNIEYWDCAVCGQTIYYNESAQTYYTTDPFLSPSHKGLTIHFETAPTCTTPGNIAYYSCYVCGKYYEARGSYETGYSFDDNCPEISLEDTVIPASHTLEPHPGYAPTCTAAGVSDYWKCTVCGKSYLDEEATQEITPENVNDVMYPPALGHNMTFVPAKAATCQETGNSAYYKCERCEKFFEDEDGENEITDRESVVIPGGDHVYGDWVSEVAATCSATGTKGHYTCAVCRKNFDADKNEIADLTIQKDMSNHVGSTELRNQKAATCKEDGYTGDLCCTACNNVITAGETISKATVAHNGKKTAAKNATCEAAGNKEYYTCTVCGKLFSDAACTQETNTAGVTIPARGHAYGAWTTVRKASCSQEGWEERVCANDAGHKEGRPIGKTAHVDDGNGYCKNCGADLKGSQRCKCGQIHTGPFAWLIKFFHGIRYFFTHMFKK